MKKTLLSIAVFSGISIAGYSQTYQKAFLEAGNIRASLMTTANMWFDPGTNAPACEFPKGSGKHAGYGAGLWVGGKINGNVATAAVLYNSAGIKDYFPGILSAAGTSDTAMARQWQRIWAIRRSTIDSFRAIVSSVGTSNPTALEAALTGSSFDDLKAWPAKGSATIKGNNNVALSLAMTPTRDYAPFVDVDGDGAYNYLAGDYPKIKGEQMLWMVFNDMAYTKTQSSSIGMGLEIHLSAYAYNRGTIADNIQFYEYKIHNYGFDDIDSTRVSIWADMDLGFANDDYIGFDSSRRLGYTYNATLIDGNGAPGHYGANPPISGIALLRAIGDNGASRVPIGGFTYFNNGSANPLPCNQDPGNAPEFYNMMSGTDRCGQPFINPLTGQATTTLFPGNPSNNSQWSECSQSNAQGDRRFILSSAPFQMQAGTTKEVAFALVISPDGGGCPNTDISGIQQTTDTAYAYYDNPPAPAGVKNTSPFSGISLSPNPAQTELNVQNLPSANTTIQVLDVTGKTISLPIQQRGTEVIVQTTTLAPGMYLLQIANSEATETRRFIKE